MRQAATPGEDRGLLTAEAAAGDVALVVEILELRAENEQVTRALSSRAVIDQARGRVLALAPCPGERAWGPLVDVPQHCDVELRDVAAALVATAEGEPLPERMRGEPRRALRRLDGKR
ncbi:ANTAR domain-containing protein [Streptomyces sp. PmtG]